MQSVADVYVIAISSLPRRVHSVYSLPVDWHGTPPCNFLFEDYICARMVYWYVTAAVRRDSSILCAGISLTRAVVIVAYTLGIYLLNLFLAFLQPKFDPSLTQDEGLEDGDAGSSLPTKQDDEFRPFIRRLPEFKFWHSATRAILIGFVCTWFEVFDIPVFWPVLVVYWLILFFLTSESSVSFVLEPVMPALPAVRLLEGFKIQMLL